VAEAVEEVESMTSTAVIRTEGLRKVYQMGATEVHALRGVDLTVEAG
jgi:predicted ABC-type transport system involved in lysophospholipase L1 biosynthesis ATPase subunit